MSNKQRADHVQANYWGGPISRAEAQKVFDEYGKVMNAQLMAVQKLDTCISFLMEKFSVTIEDVNKWVAEKVEEAKKTSLEKAVEKAEATQPDRTVDVVTGEVTENGVKVDPLPTDPNPIVLTDAN